MRGIEIRGEAELLMSGGKTVMAGFSPAMFRITPEWILSWGLNPVSDIWKPTRRSVNMSEGSA
jgi:hypothetical protein